MIDKKKLYCNPNSNNQKINCKKIVKNKQIPSKIFKNLSQLPIQIHLEGKQNLLHNNNKQNCHQPQFYIKNMRVQSALSQYQDTRDNKKRLSFDSTNKKYERDSVISRNSFTKKHSRTKIQIQDTSKQVIAQDRRKYNNSCCSALQQRVKYDKKKMSSKVKRNSINVLPVCKNILDKSQAKKVKQQKKDDKSIILKQKQKRQKSKNKKRRRQSILFVQKTNIDKNATDKLKGSTTATGFQTKNDKICTRKKQSQSSSIINLYQKQLKDKKKKKKPVQKAQKIDQNTYQYPINKYQNDKISKQHIFIPLPRPIISVKQSIKNQSRSRKDLASKDCSAKKSNSKDRSGKDKSGKKSPKKKIPKNVSSKCHKKDYSLLQQINYSSCINIPSNSSGLINSYTNSSENRSKIKILDHWQYQYISQQNPTSINFDEIKYYESSNFKKDIYEKQFVAAKFKNKKHYKQRIQIQDEISSEYPNFNELQLKFLASVVFIQRKWRQNRLYKQIFNHYMSRTKQEIVESIQKSNSIQLHISFKSNQKSHTQSPKKKFINSQQLYQQSPKKIQEPLNQDMTNQTLAQTQVLNTLLLKQPINRTQNISKIQLPQSHNNNLTIQIKAIDPTLRDDTIRRKQRKNNKGQYSFFNQKNNKQHYDSPVSIKISPRQNYQFLQRDIFPNINYLLIKKQQAKEQYNKKDKQIKLLHKRDIINYYQYNRLRQKNVAVYQQMMKKLIGSKVDIKKGYLKFIQSYKDVKHEALRKVSSQDDFMSAMYKKIFHFDQKIQGSGVQSTQSLKKLTKKILIRREYYQTQLISSNLLHNSKFQDNGYSQRAIYHDRQQNRSTHSYINRRQKDKNKDFYLDLQFINNQQQDSNHLKDDYTKSRLYNQNEYDIQEVKSVEQEENIQNAYQTKIIVNKKDTIDIGFQRMKESHVEYINDQLLHEQELLLTDPIYDNSLQKYFSKEENMIRQIYQEIITGLTHELFMQLLKIDQRRQNQLQIINSQYDPRKIRDILDEQIISVIHNEDEVQIVEQDNIKQIYRIQGIKDRIDQLNRKHRNSNIYNISPASSERFSFDTEDILLYVKQFFIFMKNNDLISQIVNNLNKNQGFRPLEYLKFLRDFEIPQDQYEPMISNQIFMQWEDYFYSKQFTLIKEENYSNEIRQSITIFHRCIFEAIISLVQEHRPYGEKGIPFPWQTAFYFPKTIKLQQIDNILKFCLQKIQYFLTLGCGIIDEKHLIYSQQNLQRVHEQNEDRIIDMLQKQLEGSPHGWYQVEQHTLQIKIQIDSQILQYLILQALDDLLEHF